MQKRIIIPGDILLSQIILEELPKKEGSRIRRFRCECLNCGKVSDKYINTLIQAKTGCHCTRSKWSVKKEPKRSPEEKKLLNTWNNMKERCYNPKSKSYYLYGDKGITICEDWKDSFDQFYKDMGPRPDGMSIDRIDGKKGYCKENCRWADRKTQNSNRTYCTMVGDITLSQWAENQGIDINSHFYMSYIHTYYKKGFSLDDILKKYHYLLKRREFLDNRPEEERQYNHKRYQNSYYLKVTKPKRQAKKETE